MRNASKLYAKNSTKCAKLVCKKQCDVRKISMQKTVRQFSANFAVFLAYIFGAFSVFFAGKLAENCMKILHIFQAFL